MAIAVWMSMWVWHIGNCYGNGLRSAQRYFTTTISIVTLRVSEGSIDWISPYTYLAVNYYEPLNGWRTGERLGYEERALRGVDVNVEQALWDSHWVLEASGGYWKGYDADKRQGEWQPAGSVGIRYYPLDYLSVYADYAYHHDHVDTDRFAVGVEFSYPGKHRGVSKMR